MSMKFQEVVDKLSASLEIIISSFLRELEEQQKKYDDPELKAALTELAAGNIYAVAVLREKDDAVRSIVKAQWDEMGKDEASH